MSCHHALTLSTLCETCAAGEMCHLGSSLLSVTCCETTHTHYSYVLDMRVAGGLNVTSNTDEAAHLLSCQSDILAHQKLYCV